MRSRLKNTIYIIYDIAANIKPLKIIGSVCKIFYIKNNPE